MANSRKRAQAEKASALVSISERSKPRYISYGERQKWDAAAKLKDRSGDFALYIDSRSYLLTSLSGFTDSLATMYKHDPHAILEDQYVAELIDVLKTLLSGYKKHLSPMNLNTNFAQKKIELLKRLSKILPSQDSVELTAAEIKLTKIIHQHVAFYEQQVKHLSQQFISKPAIELATKQVATRDDLINHNTEVKVTNPCSTRILMSQGTPKVAAPARQQTGDALFGKPVNEPIAESVRLAPRRLSHDELPSPTYTHFFQPKDESTKPVKIIELRQGIFCYIPDPFTKLLYSLYSAGYNSIYDTLMRCQKLAFADYKKSGFDMNAVIERQPTHIQELLNKTVVPTNFNIHINNLLAQVATLNKNENSDLLLVFIMRIILLYESQTATMRTLIEKRFACATIQPGTNRSKKMSPIDIQDELFISDFEYFRSDKKTIYRSNNQPSAAELSNASAVFPTETNRLPSKDLSSLRLFEAKTKPEANESVEGKIKRSKRIHASQTLKNAQKHQVFAYVTARSMLELDAHACLKEYVRAHKEGTKKVEEVLQPETTQRLEIR